MIGVFTLGKTSEDVYIKTKLVVTLTTFRLRSSESVSAGNLVLQMSSVFPHQEFVPTVVGFVWETFLI